MPSKIANTCSALNVALSLSLSAAPTRCTFCFDMSPANREKEKRSKEECLIVCIRLSRDATDWNFIVYAEHLNDTYASNRKHIELAQAKFIETIEICLSWTPETTCSSGGSRCFWLPFAGKRMKRGRRKKLNFVSINNDNNSRSTCGWAWAGMGADQQIAWKEGNHLISICPPPERELRTFHPLRIKGTQWKRMKRANIPFFTIIHSTFPFFQKNLMISLSVL